MLQVHAEERRDERLHANLEDEINHHRASYAAYNQRALEEFDDAIDVFETETSNALQLVAKGTSVGVDLDLPVLIRIRSMAVDIGMSRLNEVVNELRLKTQSEGEDDSDVVGDRHLDLPGAEGIMPAARPKEAVDKQKGEAPKPNKTAEETTDASKTPDDGAAAAEQSSSQRAAPTQAEEDQGGAALTIAGTDSSDMNAADSFALSPRLVSAAAVLQAALVTDRVGKETALATAMYLSGDGPQNETKDSGTAEDEARPACRAVQAVICVDASLVAADGGVLPPTLSLLTETLQACNFETRIVLSGPHELTLPLIAKAADDSSSKATRIAMQRVLQGAPAPLLDAESDSPPDLLLCITPPTTEKGVPLPFGSSSPAARTALRNTRLGFIRITSTGSLEFGKWAMDDHNLPLSSGEQPPSTSIHVVSSLEALLCDLQPPRASLNESLRSPWMESWRGWSEFVLATDAGAAAIVSLTEQLKNGRGGGSASLLSGVGGAPDVFGGDDGGGGMRLEESGVDAVEGWLSAGELRSETAARQELREGGCLLSECDRLWNGLEGCESVQILTDELVHALCSMPPNVYTQCSVGTQGKVLSIPALVKRYILGNSVTAIWKRQDRGGKRKLALCLVLDLTPSHSLDQHLTCGIIALITSLLRMQYAVHVLAFSHTGVWVVHVGGESWESASKARLLSILAAAAGANSTAGAEPHSASEQSGSCHVRQAIALGVQLLLASPLAATSPKMLWLLTAGVAHCSKKAISSVCKAAEAKSVAVTALSMRAANLEPLGCPRWLSANDPSRLPHLIASIFMEERPPPPPEPPIENAALAIRACAASPSAIKQIRRTGPDASAALAAAAAAGNGSAKPPCNVYLSGALDYTISAPEASNDQPQPPPEEDDPLDDEIAAFFKKVKSSWRHVRSNTKLLWSKKGITAHDGAILARIFIVETREPAPWNLRNLSLESNSLGDSGIAMLSWALAKGALSNLTRLNLTGNKISHDGIRGLSTALKAGGLPHLEWLFLNGNRISDKALQTLTDVLQEESGVLSKLQQLWLHENEIGDEGVTALFKAVHRAAGAHLSVARPQSGR